MTALEILNIILRGFRGSYQPKTIFVDIAEGLRVEEAG